MSLRERALLSLVVAVGFAGTIASSAKVTSQALERSRANEHERALVPTVEARLDSRVFELAVRLIPSGDTFAVVTAENVAVPQIARDAAPVFGGYRLLPRRRLLQPRLARWVLAYGVDVRALGLPHRVIARVPPESSIARR